MEYKELEKKREKKTKDGTCGDGGLLSLRFVLHHQHTQVETRDNHPLPDSPPSISSHGGTKKKKRENKTQAAEPLSLPVPVALAPMLSSTTLSPVYKALTQFFLFFLSSVFPIFHMFYFLLCFFSPTSVDKLTRVDLFPSHRIKDSRVHVDCPGSVGSLQTPTSTAQLVFFFSSPLPNDMRAFWKWQMVQSGGRVKLSLQLAHRHLFLLIDRILSKKKNKTKNILF